MDFALLRSIAISSIRNVIVTSICLQRLSIFRDLQSSCGPLFLSQFPSKNPEIWKGFQQYYITRSLRSSWYSGSVAFVADGSRGSSSTATRQPQPITVISKVLEVHMPLDFLQEDPQVRWTNRRHTSQELASSYLFLRLTTISRRWLPSTTKTRITGVMNSKIIPLFFIVAFLTSTSLGQWNFDTMNLFTLTL